MTVAYLYDIRLRNEEDDERGKFYCPVMIPYGPDDFDYCGSKAKYIITQTISWENGSISKTSFGCCEVKHMSNKYRKAFQSFLSQNMSDREFEWASRNPNKSKFVPRKAAIENKVLDELEVKFRKRFQTTELGDTLSLKIPRS